VLSLWVLARTVPAAPAAKTARPSQSWKLSSAGSQWLHSTAVRQIERPHKIARTYIGERAVAGSAATRPAEASPRKYRGLSSTVDVSGRHHDDIPLSCGRRRPNIAFGSRLYENSARYAHTRNFEARGEARSRCVASKVQVQSNLFVWQLPSDFERPIPPKVLKLYDHRMAVMKWRGQRFNSRGSDHFKAATADHVEWLRRLERIGRSDSLRTVSDALPRSLVHSDLHPGDIVLRSDGLPVIIDWGNVCVAPPMLGRANIIRIDSTERDIIARQAVRSTPKSAAAPIIGRVPQPLLCIYLGSPSRSRTHGG
jgi:hypothetical protein